MSTLLNPVLVYILAVVFTLFALVGKPKGRLMTINMVVIPILLLLLILGASPLFRSESQAVAAELGKSFDYGLFASMRWWILFVPIIIMAIRLKSHSKKNS